MAILSEENFSLARLTVPLQAELLPVNLNKVKKERKKKKGAADLN